MITFHIVMEDIILRTDFDFEDCVHAACLSLRKNEGRTYRFELTIEQHGALMLLVSLGGNDYVWTGDATLKAYKLLEPLLDAIPLELRPIP